LPENIKFVPTTDGGGIAGTNDTTCIIDDCIVTMMENIQSIGYNVGYMCYRNIGVIQNGRAGAMAMPVHSALVVINENGGEIRNVQSSTYGTNINLTLPGLVYQDNSDNELVGLISSYNNGLITGCSVNFGSVTNLTHAL
jgi:hypothetical protein